MDTNQDTVTLDDLQRRSADILSQLRQTGRPITLTIDGGPALVVQDASSYRKLVDLAEEAAAVEGIRRGLEDVRAGRTQPLDEAFEEIRRSFGPSTEA